MYMSPTLPPSGVAWVIRAWPQLIEVLSRHIGSGPGVLGSSGMQVKALVPERNVRMPPVASMATPAAGFATPEGAADRALLINCASVCFGAAAAAAASGVTSRASSQNQVALR